MEDRFEVVGLVTVYRRADWWHCTYYLPAGRRRRKLNTKNRRQAERRARELADLLAAEDWAGSTRLANAWRLQALCEPFGQLPLSGITSRATKYTISEVR